MGSSAVQNTARIIRCWEWIHKTNFFYALICASFLIYSISLVFISCLFLSLGLTFLKTVCILFCKDLVINIDCNALQITQGVSSRKWTPNVGFLLHLDNQEEFADMSLNSYWRTVDEFAAPFRDQTSAVYRAGLRLVSLETKIILCPMQTERLKEENKGKVPDSKVHVANMGPIWGRQDPGGPHVRLMNFAIWGRMPIWRSQIVCLSWLVNTLRPERKDRHLRHFQMHF